MARIKIHPHMYNSQDYNNNNRRIRIQPRRSNVINTLPYNIERPAIDRVSIYSCGVECFDGYSDTLSLGNIVISGASSFPNEPNGTTSQRNTDYKMNILSKYMGLALQKNVAILVISGQGSNAVSAYDVYKPLICSKNNPYYTPLDIDYLIQLLCSEFNKFCNTVRPVARNVSVLKIVIKMMAITKRNIHDDLFSSVEELEEAIDMTFSQGGITENFVNQSKRDLRNYFSSFETAIDFLSYYFTLLEDVLYPIIGTDLGYNTSKLNSGFVLQIKVKPISSSLNEDEDNLLYNRCLSNLLKADFKNNFNATTVFNREIIVILDHLSYEQAETFSWIWNDDTSWLCHQEHLFMICVQENYLKQMMQCDGFDGKIDKWYYLNHNNGAELEALFGEELVYNTTTDQHTEYGGIISVNRILKIPTGEGRHKVPAYRPKYPRTFFQNLQKGEGLLKTRNDQKAHQFKCI